MQSFIYIFAHLIIILETGAGQQQQPSAVKNLEEVRQSVVREFLASCRASKLCMHCHASSRPIRQESHVKILHGRMPPSGVIKSMLKEKIKLAAFCLCCFLLNVVLAVCGVRLLMEA